MEIWIWVQRCFQITTAFSCIAIVVVLFNSLKAKHRSTAKTVFALFGTLVLAAGLSCLGDAVFFRGPFAWSTFVARAMLAIVVVVAASALIRRIPRAVAFQDRKNIRAAAQELRQSKERFQRAIDGSFSGLWEWNIDSNEIWYSPRFREMLGYVTEEEFPNEMESFKSALHPEDSEQVWAMVDRHLHDQENYDVEYQLRTKSGEYRWFNARGLAIRNSAGRPYIMSGSIQDIDGRKQAEEVVRRRDEYLRQKHKMEALGELAGETAHEFNNVLQAISGQIQFAERSLADNSAAKEDLALASSLIEQSAQFTRQLLDLSRRRPTDTEPVNLNEFVSRLASLLRPMLGAQIDLDVRLGKRVGRIVADASALQQALLNLCINGRDAMENGGKLILQTGCDQLTCQDVARYPDLEPGPYATISVIDNGCGMTEDAKSRIFEPFFTTKKFGKGTGLGLAVAYGLIKEHGGIIEFETLLGHGSTFKIFLPATQKKPSGPIATVAPELTSSEDCRRAVILYAEDNEVVRRTTTELLNRHGHQVLVACDGREAIEFAKLMSHIDIALLDVDMPEMGGGAVFRQLREQRPKLPIVFCSGYASQLINQDILESEYTWLIDKPFKASALVNLLDQVLAVTKSGMDLITT